MGMQAALHCAESVLRCLHSRWVSKSWAFLPTPPTADLRVVAIEGPISGCSVELAGLDNACELCELLRVDLQSTMDFSIQADGTNSRSGMWSAQAAQGCAKV